MTEANTAPRPPLRSADAAVLTGSPGFDRVLTPALLQLSAARRRAHVAATLRSAARGVTVLSPFAALALLAGRSEDRTAVSGVAMAALAVALATGLGVRCVRSIRRDRPSLADAAERLDLACGGGNRIATALDLVRAADASPLARAAVGDGLFRLHECAGVRPVLPGAAAGPGGWAGAAGLGLAMLTAVAFWPARSGADAPAALGGGRGPAVAIASPGRPAMTPDPSTVDRPHQNPTADAPGSAAGRAAPAAPVARTPAGTAGGGDGGAGTVAGRPSPGQATADTGSAAPAGAAADGTAPDAQGGLGAASDRPAASPAPVPGVPSAALGPTAAGAAPGPDRGASPGATPAAANAAAAARSRSEPSPPGQVPQDGASGQRSASSGDSGNGSKRNNNGQGQSSGQSPPKKSRGVPPAMAGQRLPDTVAGPPLNGPDERKTVPLPPGPRAAGRAELDAVAPATPTESAAASMPVPPEDQAAAAAYFARLHRNDTD